MINIWNKIENKNDRKFIVTNNTEDLREISRLNEEIRKVKNEIYKIIDLCLGKSIIIINIQIKSFVFIFKGTYLGGNLCRSY